MTTERNERTSARVAAIAARILNGQEVTPQELRALAASALTQAPDRAPAENPPTDSEGAKDGVEG